MQDKTNPMLVNDLTWPELTAALDSTYTTSIKAACRVLKCSRSWVTQFVRPHVHYIYLAPHYVYAAFRGQSKESVWLNTNEFKDLICSSMTCTRQTIAVPVELLLDPDCVAQFQSLHKRASDEYGAALSESIKDGKRLPDRSKIMKPVLDYFKSHLSDLGQTIYGDGSKLPNAHHRSATPAAPAKVRPFKLSELQAVHDRKDYGDTDESVYRELFLEGCYRLQLSIPDADGVAGEKIFYLSPEKDEAQHMYNGESVSAVLISYADYLAYLA